MSKKIIKYLVYTPSIKQEVEDIKLLTNNTSKQIIIKELFKRDGKKVVQDILVKRSEKPKYDYRGIYIHPELSAIGIVRVPEDGVITKYESYIHLFNDELTAYVMENVKDLLDKNKLDTKEITKVVNQILTEQLVNQNSEIVTKIEEIVTKQVKPINTNVVKEVEKTVVEKLKPINTTIDTKIKEVETSINTITKKVDKVDLSNIYNKQEVDNKFTDLKIEDIKTTIQEIDTKVKNSDLTNVYNKTEVDDKLKNITVGKVDFLNMELPENIRQFLIEYLPMAYMEFMYPNPEEQTEENTNKTKTDITEFFSKPVTVKEAFTQYFLSILAYIYEGEVTVRKSSAKTLQSMKELPSHYQKLFITTEEVHQYMMEMMGEIFQEMEVYFNYWIKDVLKENNTKYDEILDAYKKIIEEIKTNYVAKKDVTMAYMVNQMYRVDDENVIAINQNEFDGWIDTLTNRYVTQNLFLGIDSPTFLSMNHREVPFMIDVSAKLIKEFDTTKLGYQEAEIEYTFKDGSTLRRLIRINVYEDGKKPYEAVVKNIETYRGIDEEEISPKSFIKNPQIYGNHAKYSFVTTISTETIGTFPVKIKIEFNKGLVEEIEANLIVKEYKAVDTTFIVLDSKYGKNTKYVLNPFPGEDVTKKEGYPDTRAIEGYNEAKILSFPKRFKKLGGMSFKGFSKVEEIEFNKHLNSYDKYLSEVSFEGFISVKTLDFTFMKRNEQGYPDYRSFKDLLFASRFANFFSVTEVKFPEAPRQGEEYALSFAFFGDPIIASNGNELYWKEFESLKNFKIPDGYKLGRDDVACQFFIGNADRVELPALNYENSAGQSNNIKYIDTEELIINCNGTAIPNMLYNKSYRTYQQKTLKTLTLNNVTEIGEIAFANNHYLETVYINNSHNLKQIHSGAFGDCTGLKTIYLDCKNPPIISKNNPHDLEDTHGAFAGCHTPVVVKVPKKYLQAYRDNEEWAYFQQHSGSLEGY